MAPTPPTAVPEPVAAPNPPANLPPATIYGKKLIPASVRVKRTLNISSAPTGNVAKKPRIEASPGGAGEFNMETSSTSIVTKQSNAAPENLDDEFESYMNEMKALGAI